MENIDNKDKDLFNAIDNLDKKTKKGKKATKETEIKIKDILTFKNNELAVNINKFLSTNIDPKAGECLFGENLARTGEYYGLKSTPIIGLAIATIGVVVVFVNKVFKLKKQEKKNDLF